MDSVARLRDSEEDVYYRIDSMLLVGKEVLVACFCVEVVCGGELLKFGGGNVQVRSSKEKKRRRRRERGRVFVGIFGWR